MTSEKFIQSFHSYRKGDKGYCRLATISTKNLIYKLGFWFEIEKRNENAIIFTAKSNSYAKKPYSRSFVINRVAHLEALIDKLRQKAKDDLQTFLRHSEPYNGYIQIETIRQGSQCA